MKTRVEQKLEIYNCDKYSLSTVNADDGLVLKLHINSEIAQDIYTSYYPRTFSTLRKVMPKVLTTECFNEAGKPFCQEVKNTELGHLFEHILIQKMTDIKKYRNELQIFDGMTSWDWNADRYGSFDIWVSGRVTDLVAFFMAVTQTIEVFNQILNSNK
jgi:hypothetical protein